MKIQSILESQIGLARNSMELLQKTMFKVFKNSNNQVFDRIIRKKWHIITLKK